MTLWLQEATDKGGIMFAKSVAKNPIERVREFFTSPKLVELESETQNEDTHPILKFSSDSRLWRARKGVFATYRVYPSENEKVIFRVWPYVHSDTLKKLFLVFPVSYYKDHQLVMRVTRAEEGKQPFLSGGVLFQGFDILRIPEKIREELEPWADLIMAGVKRHDERVNS